MDDRSSYECLRNHYERAMNVCDPVQHKLRQQNLLHCLAHYILERDKPEEECDDPEQEAISSDSLAFE